MPEIDPMSKHGAEILASRIRTYWASKGILVSPKTVREPDPTGKREYIYVVRSDISLRGNA